jgi:hypothetical protein
VLVVLPTNTEDERPEKRREEILELADQFGGEFSSRSLSTCIPFADE